MDCNEITGPNHLPGCDRIIAGFDGVPKSLLLLLKSREGYTSTNKESLRSMPRISLRADHMTKSPSPFPSGLKKQNAVSFDAESNPHRP
jgi:hypothetical protein